MKNYIRKVNGNKVPIKFYPEEFSGGRTIIEHSIIGSDYNPMEDFNRKNTNLSYTFSIYAQDFVTDLQTVSDLIISILDGEGIVEVGHERIGVKQCYVESWSRSYKGGVYQFKITAKEYVAEGYQVSVDEKLNSLAVITQAVQSVDTQINELVSLAEKPSEVVSKVGTVVDSVFGSMRSLIKLTGKPKELLDKITSLQSKTSALGGVEKLHLIKTAYIEFDYSYKLAEGLATDDELSYAINSHIYLALISGVVGKDFNDNDEIKNLINAFKSVVYFPTNKLELQDTLENVLSTIRGLYHGGLLNTRGRVWLECKDKPYLVAWYQRYGSIAGALDDLNIYQLYDLNSCEKDVLIYENT